ncbi:uncharacterized protein A1O5_02442 [Cladophialophora psammophila CBS 110553]|uniref:Cytochrome c oxidase assembly factor 3 n=1 Tax=Cladophialophora psammophila CBS 110553 TaxID=1182543 RepID=W9X1S2_9EURO|nr:uncharacterized protein A1O5_02442 [Cladophialophora psammophila CBS 110553]EXJ74148.1 hypothetical protein A1O5_02442 [Cladophialophora psammophila CBS 110553]
MLQTYDCFLLDEHSTETVIRPCPPPHRRLKIRIGSMHSSLPLRAGLLKRSSYYNSDYRSGAALLRARRPYLVKNTLTGIAIFGFAIGVFAFTLRAVGQETFDDVIVPSDTDAVAPNSSPAETARLQPIQNQSPKTPTA